MLRRIVSKRLCWILGVLAALWLVLAGRAYTLPVVFLHYSAAGRERVTYFFNEDNDIIKDGINPGASLEFRTARHPHADYFIDVSLPFASRDGVEIKPPFSRVDIYIGADTKITRTVIKTDFLARFAFE
jgi:hypothetical protein